MGLLSIFQRNKQTLLPRPRRARGGKSAARQAPLANAQNPADAAEAMREVRARARTRLMGATVLLLIGVIGFPLLFETQPRPIPVDLPIEIPARNAAARRRRVVASAPAARRPRRRRWPRRCRRRNPFPTTRGRRRRCRRPRRRRPPAPRSAFASLAAALTSSPAPRARATRPRRRPTSRRRWAAPARPLRKRSRRPSRSSRRGGVRAGRRIEADAACPPGRCCRRRSPRPGRRPRRSWPTRRLPSRRTPPPAAAASSSRSARSSTTPRCARRAPRSRSWA